MAAQRFPGTLVLSSSFGAQAAVMLSLATRVVPDIQCADRYRLPFSETYRFADELTAKLKLNLKVYRAVESPAWLEARHGKLWEKGLEGLKTYNQLAKVEPCSARSTSSAPVLGSRVCAARRQNRASRSISSGCRRAR